MTTNENLPDDLEARLGQVWDCLDQAPASLAAGVVYARGMHQRSFEYYASRIRKLGLKGEKVLDAGCGTGTWSFALRSVFDEVIGLDASVERINVAKWLSEQSRISGMEFRDASILSTGLPDSSVDAVFCYSVLISSVPLEGTLAEFRRVLKPGGVIYICLNGIGWSYYLRDERGLDDEKYAEMGREGLYNTLVRSLPERELNIVLGKNMIALHGDSPAHKTNFARLWMKIAPFVGRMKKQGMAITAAEYCAKVYLTIRSKQIRRRSDGNAVLRNIADLILIECGARYFIQMAVDIAGLTHGWQSEFSHASAGRGYLPEEIEKATLAAGLIDFQWACEGLLTGANMPDPPAPIHDGYVDGHLKVWEFFTFKPDESLAHGIDPDWFRDNARRAMCQKYMAQGHTPMLTNVGSATVPEGWTREALNRANIAGGKLLITSLAEKICRGAEDDRERVARLICFAQDALAHHPLVQAFGFNGAAVTDPAHALFLGIGRCGTVAPLIASLCESIGIKARIESVPAHIFGVAEIDDEEVLLEADVFKQGIIPLGHTGNMLTFSELLKDPRITDPLPNFNTWWAVHYRDEKDIWGRKPYGYREIDGAIAIYASYFEPGPMAYLPKVPTLTVKRSGAMLLLEWDDVTPFDGAVVEYRAVVRKTSRCWDYNKLPETKGLILSPPPAEIELQIDTPLAVEIEWPDVGYVEVSPQLKERPDVFCWPSNEIYVATAEILEK